MISDKPIINHPKIFTNIHQIYQNIGCNKFGFNRKEIRFTKKTREMVPFQFCRTLQSTALPCERERERDVVDFWIHNTVTGGSVGTVVISVNLPSKQLFGFYHFVFFLFLSKILFWSLNLQSVFFFLV